MADQRTDGTPAETDASPPNRDESPNAFVRTARAPYARGLPELDLLPDDAARNRVLAEVERSMMPRSLKDVVGFLVAVALFLSVPGAVAYLVSRHALPPMGAWNDRILIAITIVGYTAVVYVALRRDMPKLLRKRLNEMGIPVCMRCGFDLRAASATARTCTECGGALTSRERSAIARAHRAA